MGDSVEAYHLAQLENQARQDERERLETLEDQAREFLEEPANALEPRLLVVDFGEEDGSRD